MIRWSQLKFWGTAIEILAVDKYNVDHRCFGHLKFRSGVSMYFTCENQRTALYPVQRFILVAVLGWQTFIKSLFEYFRHLFQTFLK